ncbi:hypothetical protein ACHAW6_004847, partial [Cyclotella cf. meneghiniana]
TPLNITLPDGKIIKSTNVGNLNLPGLGDAATIAHVIPGLAHSSLISVKQLCNNGCIAHSSRHRPPGSTPFLSWPGLNADAIRKYLPLSTATAKGHIKKTPAGIQSTRPKQPTIRLPAPLKMTIPPNTKIKHIPAPLTKDLFSAHEINDVNHIFCWATLADQIDGTTYTNLAGRFPTMSLKNKQYIFVAYDYTTNAIIVRAITDREAPTIIAAFDDVFSYLERKGFKPQFNVLDNEASLAITKYLRSQHIKWQCVPPNEHRINAAERAIQTFKNHFIAELCTPDRDFPSQSWDELLPHA